MIDPLQRWREFGEKPDYAGLPSFSGMPYTEDPAELAGVDVAIVGAPTDDLVSDRPGARFGPRAIRAASCPPGPHLEAGVDGFAELTRGRLRRRAGPARPTPPRPTRRSSARSARCSTPARCRSSSAATTASPSPTSAPAPPASGGPLGLVHFDTHTDTGAEVFGVEVSHGTPMRRLVEAGQVDPGRYVQVGLRGYWPGEEEFAWQAERGITSLFMHDVRELGIDEVVERAAAVVGEGPVFLSVDIDVLDPAFAPGTGTPEPGGMTSAELLRACRLLASRLELVGAEVVEVIPTAVGSADITALAAERVVREIVTGIALRRGG